MYETIRLFSTLIAIISGVIGGGIALTGYIDDLGKRLDDRKKQTFQLVTMFYSNELVNVRKALLAKKAKDFCDPSGPTFQGAEAVTVFTHVEFFDAVVTCTETGLCDGETAQQFFSPYANWHWPSLKRHIEQVRADEAFMNMKRPYGYGIEKLATTPAVEWFEKNCVTK